MFVIRCKSISRPNFCLLTCVISLCWFAIGKTKVGAIIGVAGKH